VPPHQPAPGEPERRRYESPLRRAQAAETRDRIVAAGAELVHGSPRWDWRDLTVRAVAEQAGVNHRTVYRHFASERDLHDAIVRRLEEEAGEPLAGLDLESLPDVTARVFSYLSSFALRTRAGDNPTLVEVDERRRQALRDAVEPATAAWSETDREMAAAVLDVLWTVNSYDRLTAVWRLDADEASRAVAGVVQLIVEAIREGRVPWAEEGGAQPGTSPRGSGKGRSV
jgi:AcrR family transcriptional regulator